MLLITVMLMPVISVAVYGAENSIAVGDIMTYGHYEQGNDLDNGLEPVEWTMLDVQDGWALLLSRYALDAKPYHEAREDDTWKSYGVVYWDTCTLRAWLNGEFLEATFKPGGAGRHPDHGSGQQRGPERGRLDRPAVRGYPGPDLPAEPP